jgi:hypothetical protein
MTIDEVNPWFFLPDILERSQWKCSLKLDSGGQGGQTDDDSGDNAAFNIIACAVGQGHCHDKNLPLAHLIKVHTNVKALAHCRIRTFQMLTW